VLGEDILIIKGIQTISKRGIEKEQLLSDIQHMKDHGKVFEPKIGEIKYVF
jgi:hypothetical protein